MPDNSGNVRCYVSRYARVGETSREGTTTRAQAGCKHYRRMSVGLIGVRQGVGKEYWQEPEWQLANEGYVSLFR